MYITCKCLNVSIKTRGSQLGNFTQEQLDELNEAERSDAFFKQNLATATELEGISKEQSGLVESRNVGSWVVNRCLNCSVFTHAVHREHGAALVLINTNIVMTPDEVEKLKTAPNYSSIFRVVVEHSLDDTEVLEAPTKYSVSQLPNTLQLALANLQQQLEQAVHRKAVEAEEKIRLFTAEQHQLLEHFREQAHTEHRLLARVICDQQETKSLSKVDATVPVIENVTTNFAGSPFKFNNAKAVVTQQGGLTGESNIRHQAAAKHPASIPLNGDADGKNRRLQAFRVDSSSYDAEALFPLEGMEDLSNVEPSHPSEDESDTDGQEEGVHIPRGFRGGHPTLAKSLPVSVPNFSCYVRRTMQDQDDDQISKDSFDPHNIRASIKALAKSVHGDTVFGDLPRPRFSTQI